MCHGDGGQEALGESIDQKQFYTHKHCQSEQFCTESKSSRRQMIYQRSVLVGICIISLDFWVISWTKLIAGKFCENKIPYCKAGYNYCVNGATCVAMEADYRLVSFLPATHNHVS